MGGSKQGASASFTRDSLGRSRRAFDVGFPLLQKGMGMSSQAITLGGEPGYMGRAIEGATANAQDAAYLNSVQQGQGVARVAGEAVAGGNAGQAMTPETYGAKMAQIVANSGISRQNAKIGNLLDAAGVGLGQAGGAGQAQTQALSHELGAISMRPGYNEAYANVLAGVNAAGTVYGAGQKAGWWAQPRSSAAPPNTTTTWMGGNAIY